MNLRYSVCVTPWSDWSADSVYETDDLAHALEVARSYVAGYRDVYVYDEATDDKADETTLSDLEWDLEQAIKGAA